MKVSRPRLTGKKKRVIETVKHRIKQLKVKSQFLGNKHY